MISERLKYQAVSLSTLETSIRSFEMITCDAI